jgi:hypothetical protein
VEPRTRITIFDDPRYFRSGSGAVEFVKFEGRLHALDTLDAAQAAAVHAETLKLDREVERITGQAEEARAETSNGDEMPAIVDAALDDWLFDARAWVSDDWLFFTRASNVALLLTLLETLLDDLVAIAEERTGLRRENVESDRKRPNIDRQLIFLERGCEMVIPLTRTHRRELDDIRSVRNKLIHTLGKDVPDQVRARLQTLASSGDDTDFVKSDEFVEHAFRVVGEIAIILETAFDDRFG